jgi:hypothetical protein
MTPVRRLFSGSSGVPTTTVRDVVDSETVDEEGDRYAAREGL